MGFFRHLWARAQISGVQAAWSWPGRHVAIFVLILWPWPSLAEQSAFRFSLGGGTWEYLEFIQDANDREKLVVSHNGGGGNAGFAYDKHLFKFSILQFSAEARGDFTVGVHDYFSETSGSYDGQRYDHNSYELTVVANFPITASLGPIVVPIVAIDAGIGYGRRSYQEIGRGNTTANSEGIIAGFYDRRTWYEFVPMTLRATVVPGGNLQSRWRLVAEPTYHKLLIGQQTSHLEHVHGPSNTVTFFNRQNEGYGYRVELSLYYQSTPQQEQATTNSALFVRGIYESWRIPESEVASINVTKLEDDEAPPTPKNERYYEPKNTSTRQAIQLGYELTW